MEGYKTIVVDTATGDTWDNCCRETNISFISETMPFDYCVMYPKEEIEKMVKKALYQAPFYEFSVFPVLSPPRVFVSKRSFHTIRAHLPRPNRSLPILKEG